MNHRKRAFTLLELLAVIAILGLLMSILLPTLSSARQIAKAGVCLSHLNEIGHGLEIYLNENDDRFPPVRLERPSPTTKTFYINDAKRIAPRWPWFLNASVGPVINPTHFQSQINSRGYFDDTAVSERTSESGTTMTIDLFTCPSLVDEDFARDIRNGAYGYNYQYLGNTHRGTDAAHWDHFPVGRHQIRKPGATILAGDSRGAGRVHGKHSYTLDPPRLAVERNAVHFGPDDPTELRLTKGPDLPAGLDTVLYTYSPAEARHRDKANVIFVDMHARASTLKDLGYEFSTKTDVPRNTPKPILDSLTGTYSATNKLWNGDGSDPIAFGRHPP